MFTIPTTIARSGNRGPFVKLRERARRYKSEMDFVPGSPSGFRKAHDFLFGIAKGDLPTEHSVQARPSDCRGSASGALMSWSGSMFEYLMPPLVMKEPHGQPAQPDQQLDHQALIQYGRSRNVPYGAFLEAAYNARDRGAHLPVHHLLACRALASEAGPRVQNLVIAPSYATILAAQFMPLREAVENLAPEKHRCAGALRAIMTPWTSTPQRSLKAPTMPWC